MTLCTNCKEFEMLEKMHHLISMQLPDMLNHLKLKIWTSVKQDRSNFLQTSEEQSREESENFQTVMFFNNRLCQWEKEVYQYKQINISPITLTAVLEIGIKASLLFLSNLSEFRRSEKEDQQESSKPYDTIK